MAVYAVLILLYGLWGAIRSSHDQRSFFETSRLIVHGHNPYAISLKYIKENMPRISLEGLDAKGGRTMYPPSSHLLFIPFYAFLISPQLGKLAWLLGNLLSLAIIYYTFCKRYLYQSAPIYKFIFACLLIGAASTKTNLSLGQTALFSLAAFMLTITISSALLSGICLACAISKPSLMVLFCFFLLVGRRYKTIGVALLIHMGLTWLAALWLRVPVLHLMIPYFAKVYLLTSHESSVSMFFQINGASLKSILYLLHMPPQAVTILTVALYAVAFLCIYYNRTKPEVGLLSLTAVLTLLIDYHQHYDFSILFFIFPMLVSREHDKPRSVWPLVYYMLIMYMPNFSRIRLVGFETNLFFGNHPAALLAWQVFYTALLFILFLICTKYSSGPFYRAPLQKKADHI